MKPDDFLSAAKRGDLQDSDAKRVAAELTSPVTQHDRYTLIHILGKAGRREYRAIIEGYLESPEDPMLAKIALETLCSYWNEAVSYRSQVLRFCRGVHWDTEDDVKLIAISAAGEILRENQDEVLLTQLLHLCSPEQSNAVVPMAAESALLRAAGVEWHALPAVSRLRPVKLSDCVHLVNEIKKRWR